MGRRLGVTAGWELTTWWTAGYDRLGVISERMGGRLGKRLGMDDLKLTTGSERMGD